MKLLIKIKPEIPDNEWHILTQKQSKALTDFVTSFKHFDLEQTLTVKSNDKIYEIETNDIYNITIENGKLMIYTHDQQYTKNTRLYQIKEKLGTHFLQISKSEIINIHAIYHVSMKPNGTVKITFKNDTFTYSSRRYLKTIKECLQL
ncbi:LytTR family DNA-binding domain-containing protein [Staphylococcus massiliensis]|uniref:Response regulator n=1 Tax=Staphylococcus massiliensis S46 TaxID=1229783 RepID=K9AI03_9STAP|nr:LytTR family DNA-binding domain-containing protein [Staphylococcus massiliensis]EKU45736.1 response regulator [Staphylococcus massiliensis S46]MCG3400412.1 LytTR family transcriptional regulator DNA-binding domain-containing protein [Staphylococcus massiliensis]MCG3401743.1 LytTR family transcriptional regulator DNA-binding domain-containing protein [Staphylococcus massiliensis]MCG3413483.1 LytTR family transcriptional regulator DNA-binding domain-containing protein [Staphylococcus massilien